MAVLQLNQSALRNHADNAGLAGLIGNLRDYMARRAVYRQTIRELNDLSARELADLGMSRSMIRNVAYEAAWGSK